MVNKVDVIPLDWEPALTEERKDYSRYFAYIFAVSGALPGPVVDVCSVRRRVFFNILNAICILIVTSRLVVAFTVGWAASQPDTLETSINKANFILWKVMVALQAYTLALNTHRHSRAYHDSYNKALNYLKDIHVEINWKDGRKSQAIILGFGLLVAVGVSGATLVTYATVDPFFGDTLQNRTSSGSFSALSIFGRPTLFLYVIYFVSYTAYYASIASQLIILLNSFNKKFSDEVEASIGKMLFDVKEYRKAHSLISKAVNEAENILSISIGISLLFNTILQFLIIYIMTSNTHTLIENLTFITWICGTLGTVFNVVLIGNSVREKVSKWI